MRSYAALAFAGLAAAYGPGGDWGKDSWSSSKDAKPWGTGAPVYVTDIVTAYTTYCPSATQITHGTQTYTVTEATTLTITNCPCTVTRPVESTTKPASIAPAPTSKPAASGAPAPGTTYFPSVVAPSSAAPVASAPATYTGAASKAQVAGAGLLAVMGAAVVAL